MAEKIFEVTFEMLKKEFKDQLLDVSNKKTWDEDPICKLTFKSKETVDERKERLTKEKENENKQMLLKKAMVDRVCPECKGNVMVSQNPGGSNTKYYCQKCGWQHTLKSFSTPTTG